MSERNNALVRRILLLTVVAALMIAMLVILAAPGFAQQEFSYQDLPQRVYHLPAGESRAPGIGEHDTGGAR